MIHEAVWSRKDREKAGFGRVLIAHEAQLNCPILANVHFQCRYVHPNAKRGQTVWIVFIMYRRMPKKRSNENSSVVIPAESSQQGSTWGDSHLLQKILAKVQLTRFQQVLHLYKPTGFVHPACEDEWKMRTQSVRPFVQSSSYGAVQQRSWIGYVPAFNLLLAAYSKVQVQ